MKKAVILATLLFCTLPLPAGRGFNGTTNVITIPGNGNAIDITGQKLSISMWFFLPSLPGSEQDPMGKCASPGGQCQWVFFINASGHANQIGMYFRISVPLNHDQFMFCSTTLTAPAWHNVVAAIDITLGGNNALLYLDGTQCAAIGVNNSGTITTTGANLLIGESVNSVFSGLATFFTGSLAEVGIWNAKLSAGEVSGLASGVPPSHIRGANLIGYWPLWGASGTNPETDLSGNVANGTVTGATVANHCPCTK